MNRRFFSGLLGAIFSTALCAGTLVNNSDGLPQATGVADGYALVIFSQPPLAEWPNAARHKNGKLDFTAGANCQYPGSPAPPRHDFRPRVHYHRLLSAKHLVEHQVPYCVVG